MGPAWADLERDFAARPRQHPTIRDFVEKWRLARERRRRNRQAARAGN